jgi:hypothetical protein
VLHHHYDQYINDTFLDTEAAGCLVCWIFDCLVGVFRAGVLFFLCVFAYSPPQSHRQPLSHTLWLLLAHLLEACADQAAHALVESRNLHRGSTKTLSAASTQCCCLQQGCQPTRTLGLLACLANAFGSRATSATAAMTSGSSKPAAPGQLLHHMVRVSSQLFVKAQTLASRPAHLT